jgi:HsdM N-terminal domain/Putative DNA-binding domain/N-6 DNA Methylase
MNHGEIVSFIWGVADLIRDAFKRGKYQDVILPLTVLRRLDCVLAPNKEKVLKRQAELRGKGLQDLEAQLRKVSGFAFYNTSRYDFDKLLADAPHVAANLRNYIAGFSPNMREVLEKFDFDNTISKLNEAGLLFKVLERFKNVDLHPDKIDNPTMGMIFEELIRKFNEALNENPGEHFTPRDVVHLMADLMLAGDAKGRPYTETGMNGFSEAQTAKTFERPENRFLIVANKFQTGFDQPLLHTMYVDKKLGGVNAVQTLSRLNRTHPEKKNAVVLDFANEADEIKAAFEPYYETTLLSEETDPNLLYEIQTQLAAFPVYTATDVDGFARVYFEPKATQDQLYAVLAPVVDRFKQISEGEQNDFRGQLVDYVRLYAFLAQVLTFADPDLEKLYVFARHLRRLLPPDRLELPREVQQNIDMESYRIQQTGSGRIALDRKAGVLDPQNTKGRYGLPPEQMEPLSQIITDLNDRFGLNLGPEHRVTLGQMMEKLADDASLDAAARVNTRENVRLTFDHKVEAVIQEIVDSNFELYKRITDDRGFGEAIKNFLFDQYLRGHRDAAELIKRGESKTLEFKSTLRWNLKEDRQDDKFITHAVLKTVAAFLNTDGGDLLVGVADDGAIVGIERDRLDTDDKFMRHLTQVVRNGMGDRAGTCVDPKTQEVQGKTVCVVSCQRSPEPIFLKWKGIETTPEGDFFVRSGPGTVKLPPDSAKEYVRTRFPGWTRSAGGTT